MPEERIKSPGESPLASPLEGQPFTLTIATKRDPACGRDTPVADAEQTAVLNVTGNFSGDGATALAQQVEELFVGGCTTCIVRLQRIQAIDREALLSFAEWVRGRHDEGRDLRISADQPEIWELLASVADFGDALIPIADTSVQGHRKQIDTTRP